VPCVWLLSGALEVWSLRLLFLREHTGKFGRFGHVLCLVGPTDVKTSIWALTETLALCPIVVEAGGG